MTKTLAEALESVRSTLALAEKYGHAAAIAEFDMETICPPKGMEEQGEIGAMLSNEAFKLIKADEFIADAELLYERRDELDEFDRVMAEQLHRDYLKVKNITPELNHEFTLIYNRAYVRWLEAKKASDFSLFAPSLKEVLGADLKAVGLREKTPGTEDLSIYDRLLDDYERGMTTAVLDDCFEACKARLLPLLKKIQASKKTIRTDFLKRPVTDEQQAKMARYLLELMRYDFERGAFTTTEHPFTSGLGRNDVRVTTHYYPENFASSLYSIVHEGGHALFDMNQPAENHDHFITGGKTLGMHESVSRFYENRIGRSKAFIHLIYPKVFEIFPQVMEDVSEKELYEAMNLVTPSLIRTEADEFTYTFHIIIRYEIEKMLVGGEIGVDEVPAIWNAKYEEYLGVRPERDAEGALQDVHWASGFGYFPTYAIGNMYNAMYFNRMKEEIDAEAAIEAGDFETINGWMAEHVFKKADRLAPADWICDITGRSFAPDDFLDYLEEKYSELYEL